MAESDSTLQASLRSVAFHRVNGEKGEGPGLAQQFGIKAYPTFVLVNGKGELINKWVGFGGVPRFASLIAVAKADPMPLAAREARFAKKPTEKDAAAIASAQEGLGNVGVAVEHYQKAAELAGAQGGRYASAIFRNQVQGLPGGAYSLDDLKRTADQVIAYSGATQEDLMTVAFEMTNQSLSQQRPALLAPYVQKALSATADHVQPEFAPFRRELEWIDALYIQNDPPKAVALKKAMLPEIWNQDPGQVSQFVLWCAQNNVNLEEAEALARSALKSAGPGQPRALSLVALADVQARQGHPAEAIKTIEAALVELPGNKGLLSRLALYKSALPAGAGGSK